MDVAFDGPVSRDADGTGYGEISDQFALDFGSLGFDPVGKLDCAIPFNNEFPTIEIASNDSGMAKHGISRAIDKCVDTPIHGEMMTRDFTIAKSTAPADDNVAAGSQSMIFLRLHLVVGKADINAASLALG